MTRQDLLAAAEVLSGPGEGAQPLGRGGLWVFRASRPYPLGLRAHDSVFSLILLGAKSIQAGERILAFREGQSLLIGLDLLVAACVTRASPSAPHLALSILRELAADAGPVPLGTAQPSPRKRRTGG